MTYTEISIYNRRLNQHLFIGLPGSVHDKREGKALDDAVRKLAGPGLYKLLEKYGYRFEGLHNKDMPTWMATTEEEIDTFMSSYLADLYIPLPEDFRVRDLAKVSDIFREYDDEDEGFTWDKDEVRIVCIASDMAEHIKEDVNMLYPDLEVVISAVDNGDIYDETDSEDGE